MANICNICSKRVLSHAKVITCALCKQKCHCKCISIKTSEISSLLHNDDWYCVLCISDILPFNHISDDTEYLQA